MKIIFFGTSDFAVPSLIKLKNFHEISAVITKPDRPKGRRLAISPSPVKFKAGELNIPVFSIDDLSVSEAVEKLKRYEADLFIIIAYGRIVSSDLLSVPGFYSIGLHASLLPKYRGPSSINWAILNGDARTGVTVFRLNRKIDAGEIIMQREETILRSDNARTLSLRLAGLGADLLLRAIEDIKKGQAILTEQKEGEATFTPKLKKEAGVIDWTKSAGYIDNQIKAMYGWPGTYSTLKGRRVKIWEGEVAGIKPNRPFKPGEVITAGEDGIFVSCGEGILKIKEMQAEGGKRVAACDYLLGRRVSIGDFFL